MKPVDIIIVGGGPAGGMLAWSAARAGFSVILCEAHAVLPERICGAYLCPAGVRLLAELGVLDRLTGGCRELQGMIMVSPEGRSVQACFPREGHALPHGLALDRPGFDLRLLELSREAGAEIRMGARVKSFQRRGAVWEVELMDGTRLGSGLLVGADGRKSVVARLLGLNQPPRRTRAATHIDLPTSGPLPPFGQMHVFEDGSYAGLNPLAPGRVNVSFVCRPEALKEHGAAGWLNRRRKESALGQQIPEVGPGAKFGTTFPATASVSSPVGDHAALIGDASGFIDPLTGEGIYTALWSARALIAALVDCRNDVPRALLAYSKARRGTQRSKAALSHLFQTCISRPGLANGVLRFIARRQGAADAFIGMIGNTYSPPGGLARMFYHALGASPGANHSLTTHRCPPT